MVLTLDVWRINKSINKFALNWVNCWEALVGNQQPSYNLNGYRRFRD